MILIAKILLALVAFEHLYFLYLEMFAWETIGKKVFKGSMAPELFTPTKTLAANQGLYNGFLAAGLIWSFFIYPSFYPTIFSSFFVAGFT